MDVLKSTKRYDAAVAALRRAEKRSEDLATNHTVRIGRKVIKSLESPSPPTNTLADPVVAAGSRPFIAFIAEVGEPRQPEANGQPDSLDGLERK